MKKITFLLLFTFLTSVSLTNAQSIEITEINGLSPSVFFAGNTPVKTLKTNTSVDVTVSYVDLPAATATPGKTVITVRRVRNDYGAAFDPSTAEVDANTTGSVVIAFTPTAETTDFHLQAYAFNHPSTTVLIENYLYNIDVSDTAVLSTEDFNKNKLESFYSASKDAIVVKDRIEGGFSIYNLLGQSVLEGEIANADEISVETLKSGLYVLSTKEGTLKFVK